MSVNTGEFKTPKQLSIIPDSYAGRLVFIFDLRQKKLVFAYFRVITSISVLGCFNANVFMFTCVFPGIVVEATSQHCRSKYCLTDAKMSWCTESTYV